MKPEWKEFLLDNGAELDGDQVTNFGNPQRELEVATTGHVIADQSHFGLISARGEDVSEFLQGQLTNDIRDVSETKAQYSAYCTPKGRMLSNFLIFKRGDTYYLSLPRNLLEATLKRLSMFILMSKVVLEDASDSLVRMGYAGPEADKELNGVLGIAPKEPFEASQKDDLSVIRLPGMQPRFQIVGGLDAITKLWETLNVRGTAIGEPGWALLDILSGTPFILPETTEAFIPQMVNLQLTNGVSFKKGCYTGQEIVARMQYLGKLKRRMYLAHVQGDIAPKPGDELFSAGSSSGQGTGKIVNASPSPEGGYQVLAVVEISSQANNKIHLGEKNGPILEFAELPYPFQDS